MKCIYCETDNLKRDRGSGRCKKCQRAFAFEPATMDRRFVLTDKAFQAAVRAVSENDTLFFTPRQLYYELLRRHTRRQTVTAGGCLRELLGRASAGLVLLAAFIFFIVFSARWSSVPPLLAAGLGGGAVLSVAYWLGRLWVPAAGLFFALAAVLMGAGTYLPGSRWWPLPLVPAAAILLAGLGLTLAVSGRRPRPKAAQSPARPPAIDFAFFQQNILYKWTRVHGVPPRMLPDGGRLRPALKSAAPPDVLQYSFDRLLVVDRPETADMLLANNLHFETSMPVVTLDGYPQDAFQNVLAMVRRNPALKVYCLHDASPAGCLLPLRLREGREWFPDPAISVIDRGLRPRHIAGQPTFFVDQADRRETLPAGLARSLSPGERRWLLAGRRGELANYRPAALLRIIYRMLQKTAEEEARLQAEAARDPRGFFQTRWPDSAPGQPLHLSAGGTPPL